MISWNQHLGHSEANWCPNWRYGLLVGIGCKAPGYLGSVAMFCVMLGYGQRSSDTIHVGVTSNTPSHDTLNSGYREVGWGVFHVVVVWSDVGMAQPGDAWWSSLQDFVDPGANWHWIVLMQFHLQSKSAAFPWILNIISWQCWLQFQWK